jgi:lysophospholipase L1-like esterase
MDRILDSTRNVSNLQRSNGDRYHPVREKWGKLMKIALIIFIVILGTLAAGEVALRLILGFGNPLIYVADEEIGYFLAPDQRVRRLGNLIAINQYSMRGSPVTAMPPEGTWRVLILGDSVANGAWWTDQGETISAQMSDRLQTTLSQSTSGKLGNVTVEVLNASANSWGPRNELAFLRRMGTFGARVLVLLINTDDLFAGAPSSLAVGRDRNYPNKKPPLAWFELFTRYILPAPKVPTAPKETEDPVDRNLEAIHQIQLLGQKNNSQVLVAMTPLLRETGEPGPRDYEHKARNRLLELTQGQDILYLDFLPIFNAHQQPGTLYRDHIHLSPTGNQLVSQTLSKAIEQKINNLEDN